MDSERIKYERMHRIPGYSPGPGLSHVPRFVSLALGPDPAAGKPSVIDYGCGTGDAGLELHRRGFDVYLVDIACNSIRKTTLEILPGRFFVAALHDLPEGLPEAGWGFCCDVLEHTCRRTTSSGRSGRCAKGRRISTARSAAGRISGASTSASPCI